EAPDELLPVPAALQLGEEALGSRLPASENCELGELLGVGLSSRHRDRDPVFATMLIGALHGTEALRDQLLAVLVASDHVRPSPHTDREFKGGLSLIGACRLDNDVVDGHPRSLLERHGPDLSTLPELRSGIAGEYARQV